MLGLYRLTRDLVAKLMDTRTKELSIRRSRCVTGRVAALMLTLVATLDSCALAHTDYPLLSRSTAKTEADSEPPYSGTVFIDPDVITPSDPSSLVDVTYTGRGERTVFDRRPADWIVIDAYLFDAQFDDGLSSEIQVNPEFGSVSAAEVAASKYARMIGQLPTILRSDVRSVWIHKGEALWGGGNANILIHVDQYVHDPALRDFEEEVLIHESGHTSLDAEHKEAPDWLAAQVADGGFISTYARDNPTREDIAESILPWLAVRYRSDRISGADEHKILNAIPHRLAYFDEVILDRDMYPIRGRVSHTLPLFISATHQALQGFVRIINHSERAGTVTIHAVDDAGQRFGPVMLSLDANATRHFNSDDLRDGAPEKGLSGSVGIGEGNWRLEFGTDLDIEPLAYTRPRGDGFLTSSHDVVAESETMRWHVPTFNPGNNTVQQSWLRVANTSNTDAEVFIEGFDDRGASSPGGRVSLTLPPNAARMLSARALEEGASEADFEFDGRLGDGTGKWRLLVSADRPIQVMSLLLSESGHLTNLSSTTRASPAGRRHCFLAGTAEVHIDAAGLGIGRLTGLEQAVCTTSLDLRFNYISDLSSLSGLTALTRLDLKDNQISDLTPLSGLSALTRLDLRENHVSDLSPLSGLTAMTKLELDDNQISDIGPLVSNPGLGDGDIVTLTNNPLSTESLQTHIPKLQSRGVDVSF